MEQNAIPKPRFSRFDILPEEIILIVLDFLNDYPLDKKSFSLVCRSFYAIESRHRKFLKPRRSEHLTNVLIRYPYVSNLDLSSCPRMTDTSLSVITDYCKKMLRSINLSRSNCFTHVGLSNLMMNCGNLVEIDLSNTTLEDLAAAEIAEAKNLERLWLAHCRSITDVGIGCIAVGCKKLKLLSLRSCKGVGDLGVGKIAVKCKDIQSLDLSYLPITNKCLPQVLELQHLKDLVLAGCLGIDDDGLADLKLECKSLEKLDMSRCLNVSHMGLSSLTSAAGCLRQLILSSSRVDVVALADSLHKFSSLESVNLDDCEVTCSVLKAIRYWRASLKELSLAGNMRVTDEGISFLVTKHKDLRKLDITCCCQITQLSVAHIMNSCTSLTSLKMGSCTLVLASAFVLIGLQCPCLEELDLTDSKVDDEGLKSISRCSQLLSLKLGICPNITDEGLTHVGMCCSKLKELNLYRSAGITDSGILAISRGCPGLESVNVGYCKSITDRSLMSLSNCSKLNTLEIRGCTLVTHLGLAAIAQGCKQLAKLGMKKCHDIDDSGMISHARSLENLKEINLSYTSITDKGLLQVASISGLQSITIFHQEGLSPEGLKAALLACSGLTKVELHVSFLSLLRELEKQLKAGCCLVLWR